MIKKLTLSAVLFASLHVNSAPTISPVIASTPAITSTAAMTSMLLTLNASQASSIGELGLNPMFFTACSKEQYEKALKFQAFCSVTKDINPSYCPLLSFFRECDQVESVDGLQPVKPSYKHVFFKSE